MALDVNWDEVLEEADNTPRSFLAELLGIADEIDEMVVLIAGKDGLQRSWYIADQQHAIAMAALFQFKMVREASES